MLRGTPIASAVRGPSATSPRQAAVAPAPLWSRPRHHEGCSRCQGGAHPIGSDLMSVHLGYVLVGAVAGFLVALRLLPLGELDLVALDLLVGDQAQEMRDTVEAGAPLIITVHDVPGRERRVSRLEHVVPGAREIVPASVRLEVHRTQLPDLARIVDARLEAARLLVLADFEPVLDENDAGLDHAAFPYGTQLQKPLHLMFGAESHDALDTGAVVPAAIEDDYLAARGKALHVALQIQLALFALARCRQGDYPKHPGADALGDALDDAALAGCVTTL